MAKPKVPPGLELRLAAAARLSSVLGGAPFVPIGPGELPEGRDRAVANRLVTTALRRHGHLNLMLERYLERGVPKKSGSFEAVLRLSLSQLLYLPELGEHSALFLGVEAAKRDPRSQHLAKLLNAVLRRAQGEADLLRDAPSELLFPEPLRRSWGAAYGTGAVRAFGAALLAGAPLDLTLRDEDPALVEALGAMPLHRDSVRVAARDVPVERLPGFAEGRWWVQDVAAALPARLLTLPPGSTVLDLCAAPGGKTAQLVKAGYAVTALDNDRQRLQRLMVNLDRLGYRADVVEADGLEFRPEQKFDGVLLDAPCSATGTLRRHPEVVWRRQAADIAGRSAMQKRFIETATAGLKPGGVLVYCVCSLEPAEGEMQARWIAEHVESLRTDPIQPAELGALSAAVTPHGEVRTHPGQAVPGDPEGTLDGFFVARFRRL